MPRRSGHPEFLERPKPAQVLPISKCPVISESPGAWKICFPRYILEAMSHNIRVEHSFSGARQPRPRANTCENRPLIVNDKKVMATFITYRLYFLSHHPLRLIPPHIEFRRDLGWLHATAVAFFPTQLIRSTGLETARWKGSHKELPRLHPEWLHLPRLHPEWLHSDQSCFCQKNSQTAAMTAPAPNKLDPSVRVLLSLRSTLTAGATNRLHSESSHSR
jgi:hypothetical protein